MAANDPRKEYWNKEYLDYWKSRVDEAGYGKSQIIDGDSNTEDDSVYETVFLKFGFNEGNILDVGCAWGRSFPLYLAHGLEPNGVDISEAMVSAAIDSWGTKENIGIIAESPAETLPFDDCCFDNLACLAVLDATFQHKAVTEFLRVTKPGAMIFITGKNNLYHQDDSEAYSAEVGARSKGHPNFFTDTALLLRLLQEQGHDILGTYFFPRRGDFAKLHCEPTPKRFYEFFIVLQRGDSFEPLPTISDSYSLTFKEMQK